MYANLASGECVWDPPEVIENNQQSCFFSLPEYRRSNLKIAQMSNTENYNNQNSKCFYLKQFCATQYQQLATT